MSLQYITNEQGKQVGVLLDLEAYQKLTTASSLDSECLVNVSHSELEALANSKLAPEKQQYLSELLAKNKETELSSEEQNQLDALLEQIDTLTLLKTRAKYTLKCLQQMEQKLLV